jgi:hypothetical protein
MRIQQLIFQGVCGYATPVRLDVDAGVARETLPKGVELEDAHALLINLLYPTRRTPRAREVLEQGGRVKLALIFETEASSFRIARKKPQTSLSLQALQSGDSTRTVATGARDVAHVLDERLNRPDLERFRALNLWTFDSISQTESESEGIDLDALDDDARDLVEQYRTALERDRLDDRIDEIEAELESIRQSVSGGLEAEEKLERARRELDDLDVTDLSDDDLELVETKDERLQELDDERERLADDEETERAKLDDLDPDPPWQRGLAWGGLVVGGGAVAASIGYHEEWRWIVLADVVGFGLVAWCFLEYLTHLEAVNIHRVRLESIRRRLGEVRKQKVDFQERVDHLLVHADADDEAELMEKYRRAEHLEDVVETQTQTVESYRDDPTFVEAKERIDDLEARRDDLERRLESLPDYVPDRYQIEMQFSSLGYEADAVRAALELEDDGDASSTDEGGDEASTLEDRERTPFERLRDIASELGLWYDGELGREPLEIWRKIAGHLIGEAFQTIHLTESGALDIGDLDRGQLDRWMQTHPEDVELATRTLALALHLTSVAIDDRIETIWIADPEVAYDEPRSSKFETVLDNAASRAHFALMRQASRA